MTNSIPTSQSEGQRLRTAMDTAIADLKTQIQAAAAAERDYRKKKSAKFIEVRGKEDIKLADDKKAWVDAETADDRYERDLADGLRQAILEEVRNYRQQMSYVQTMERSDREEYESYLSGLQDGARNVPEPEAPPEF